MIESNGASYDFSVTKSFSILEKTRPPEILQTMKNLSSGEMENTAFPFSSFLNDTPSFEADVKTMKAFQVDDKLDNLKAQLKSQTADIPDTDAMKNAIKLKEICRVEVPGQTDQEEWGSINFEACGKGFDLGINLREKSPRTTVTFPGGLCSRQSSIINLKESKSTLQNACFEYIVANKEAIEIKRELDQPQVKLDEETWTKPNAENKEEIVKRTEQDERKFGEQPQALFDDEFVNLAISQTNEDFVRRETIHLKDHQVHYDDDFVSLRSANFKGPTHVREIGRGAFGKCFKVKYALNSGKTVHVARKEIENKTNNTEDKRRNEYFMLKRLNHPNIVRCFWESIDPETKKYSITMEYMPGGSLSDLLKSQEGGLEEGLIKQYTVQLLQGLGYLHSLYILHRDIKGENLLLCEFFKVLKICDFGCSTYVDCTDTVYTDTRLVGTVPFMAPEIVSKNCYSAASDVWSVGCCIIQMATGKLPWNANRNEEFAVMYKIGNAKDPPPIPECLSPALQNLTRHCLFIDKKKRFSAEKLLNRFQKALLPEM